VPWASSLSSQGESVIVRIDARNRPSTPRHFAERWGSSSQTQPLIKAYNMVNPEAARHRSVFDPIPIMVQCTIVHRATVSQGDEISR
jgi:hypothetical protein